MKKLAVTIAALAITASAFSLNSREMYKHMGDKSVLIIKTLAQGKAKGTGQFIQYRGEIFVATAAHVIAEDTEFGQDGTNKKPISFKTVKPETLSLTDNKGNKYTATGAYMSTKADVAFIKLKDATKVTSSYQLNPESKLTLQSGDEVYTYGHPVTMEHILTKGIFQHVSKNPNSKVAPNDPTCNTNIALHHLPSTWGNSGGAIVDVDGNLQSLLVQGMLVKDHFKDYTAGEPVEKLIALLNVALPITHGMDLQIKK